MIYIESSEKIEELFFRLDRAEWAAVDTEADSLHHYAEKLSLIQITIADGDYVIDPLAALPIQRLLDALSKKFLYFHAADSDIRLLKKGHSFSPSIIFDTMIAAQVLGYPKIGLADLAEKHCGIKLSKAEQKADWSERPLDAKLIEYAANDTHYLRTIAEAMRLELKQLGREDWHRQHCAKLLEMLVSLKTEEAPENAWQIKGAKHLKGFSLTLVRELWFWRDGLARKKDKPAFKVLNSEYIAALAMWAAEHPGKDVGEWPQAPRHVKNEYRDDLNRLIEKAKHAPPAVIQKPDFKKPRIIWSEKDSKILGQLKTVRDEEAASLQVLPSLIATNASLEAIVTAKPINLEDLEALGVFLPWQIKQVGRKMIQGLTLQEK